MKGKIAEGTKLLCKFTHKSDSIKGEIIRILSEKREENTLIGVVEGNEFVVVGEKSFGRYEFENTLEIPLDAESLYEATLLSKRFSKVRLLRKKTTFSSLSDLVSKLNELRDFFPEEVLASAEEMTVPSTKNREDLRSVPLVTIDGEDAKDFDDAVWAKPLEDGGFYIIVAIADVAHYVKPGSALDKEAFARGNSFYFPDKVIPMLPEKLSNGLCSLKPGEDRACFSAHLWIDKKGRKVKHAFARGLMRSQRRYTYEEAQKSFEEKNENEHSLLSPLFKSYNILLEQRKNRGALEFERLEPKFVLNKNGDVDRIEARRRLDSHRLIEEFMILANQAAGEELEKHYGEGIYRVHPEPSPEKIDELKTALNALGVGSRKTFNRAEHFSDLIKEYEGHTYEDIIQELLLRAQSQASYQHERNPHFGLGLLHYSHFTSPIRRYADLIVHRLLQNISSKEKAMSTKGSLKESAAHLVACERLATKCEREIQDKLYAKYYEKLVGKKLDGFVAGLIPKGVFITLDKTAATVFVPVKFFGNDYYTHKSSPPSFVGRRSRKTIRLGTRVKVKLLEANVVQGAMSGSLV